jgi:hypothetical protein
MKAIYAFVFLFLIITTFVSSISLYQNGNYNISAALCVLWIVSLALWIGISSGLVDELTNSKHVTHDARA